MLLAALLAMVGSGVADPARDDEAGILKDESHFPDQALKQYKRGNKASAAWNMVSVGHNDLGGRGFNADVWEHEGCAYVGPLGLSRTGPPATRAFARLRPTTVWPCSTHATPPARRAWLPCRTPQLDEDVVVYTARYGPYAGRDVAVAGIQSCVGSRYDSTVERGLVLWDVTTPAAPVQLGCLRTACCTRGVHEFEVRDRADLGCTFDYATVPASRYPDDQTASSVRDINGDGDFPLIDITDPDAAGAGRRLRLSRATVRKMKQNLVWASVYNVSAIPIAAGVLFPAHGIELRTERSGS
jgi:hypothetical protein